MNFYVVNIMMACLCSYNLGKVVDNGDDRRGVLYLLLGLANFYLGIGGLIA